MLFNNFYKTSLVLVSQMGIAKNNKCRFLKFLSLSRPLITRSIVESLKKLVRKVCPRLSGDRSLSKEIEIVAKEIFDGRWLARINAECGDIIR